jgi:hypothetical protein
VLLQQDVDMDEFIAGIGGMVGKREENWQATRNGF